MPMRRPGALLALVLTSGCAPPPTPPSTHTAVVDSLVALLDARPELHTALVAAIDSARVEGLGSLDAFYARIDTLVTWAPDERVATPKVLAIHYVINQAPADALNADSAFSDWLGTVARAWGAFLDTPASAPAIASFAANPDYRVGDYIEPPGGWRTFNEFFAREVRPGLRPIAGPDDDRVVVASADAIFMGAWPIDAQSTVTLKGTKWPVADLLAGSAYADAFAHGSFSHSFLRITDYHRFHAPVSGVVREVRHVHGRVFVDVVRKPDGTLGAANGDGYQFNQERGFMVIESPTVGLVAMIPVGMTFISSVVMTPEVGTMVQKGDEVGWFQFGGSDMVLLFQADKVRLEAKPGTKYLMGQRIGVAID